MKKLKNILIFISLILVLFDLQGQHIEPVKNPNKYNKNKITVKLKQKENNDLVIFLINRTKDTISCFGGYDSKITFKKEVLSENNEWINFDMDSKYAYWCGTGLTVLKIPSEYYTYEVYKNKKFSGSFDTKMRFSYKLNDSLNVYSEIINVSINKKLILSPELRAIKYLEKEYELENSKSEKIRLLKLLVRNYNNNKLFEKAIKLCENWKGNENLDEVNFNYSKTISRFLQSHPNIDRYERAILASKLIEKLEEIDSTKDISNQVKKYKEHYNKHLASIEEWNIINKNCENNICFEYILINEFVQMRFKK